MKQFGCCAFLGVLLLTVNPASAQKPQLTEINFLVDGQPVDTTSNGDVTVELKFNESMNTTIDPLVKFGLGEQLDLTVPEGQGWISPTLWQGFFTISNNNPETGDGEYIFQISGGIDSEGDTMDTILSTALEKTLYICRSGELSLSTDELDFGAIAAGTLKTLNVTVFNESCADLQVTSVSFTPLAPFALITSSPPFTIPGGGSRVLTIRFTPSARQNYSHTMTITSSDRLQSQHTVQLTGTAHGPKIVVSPSNSLNFGKVEVGFDLTKTVSITNDKDEANPALSDTLHVTNITTNDEVYTVSLTELLIPPDSTEIVEVTFTPTDEKPYNGRILSIASDDATQPVRTIDLNGDASDETPPPPITGLYIDFDGFNGFINLAFLPICWSNPNDPSGLGAIWWYFSLTPINPLVAPQPDTTQTSISVGGRIALLPNTFCASLPLFGRIGSGYWYCYLWLEDGRGNRSWQSALQSTFIYDITPPGAPVVIARVIPTLQWFGANANFRLTIDIPPDPVLEREDAAEVRWKYQAKPNNANDYHGRYIFSDSDPENVQFSVPFNSELLCGDDSLYIWLADSAGNSNANNYTPVRYRFDICGPEIVRVNDDLDNIARFGQAFLDTVEITDDVPVDTAWVRYRFGGAEAEQPPRGLARIDGTDLFVVDIPQPGVTRRGLEYKVIAIDSLDNGDEGPVETSYCGAEVDQDHEEGIWFPVRTRVTGRGDFRVDTDGRPVPLISGDDETNYQLFSVPYDLDSSAVENVLEDDLGEYDKTQWRLFDYKTENPETSRFLEGSSARPFIPGRSYFIITRQENIVVDSGSGQTRRTVCNDSIRVFAGWNLIATPFNFPVDRESLSLIAVSAENVFDLDHDEISLRSYERGWNITDFMDPWKGYALFVTPPDDLPSSTKIYLVVRPKAAPGRVFKTVAEYTALQPGEWLVQISARAGQALDLENWAGVRSDAQPGFDRHELAEPPVIGKYIRVAFPHAEWQRPANDFSTDIRPASTNEQVWEFAVHTNQVETWVHLNFSFLGDFPTDAEVFIIDEALKLAQNLRANPEYLFKSGKNGSEKMLKLIVGSAEFASSAAGDIALVPAEFELLQNYPNPFNPETSIRYNLPAASNVKIEIYDLLGRRVRTLVNVNNQVAGYHQALWNGRDDGGVPVASGVYIYRITTNAQSLARKMILMK
jgi:hypothetical protein